MVAESLEATKQIGVTLKHLDLIVAAFGERVCVELSRNILFWVYFRLHIS